MFVLVLLGKHPVSVLQEICAKKRWDPPHYELLELGGPAHKKSFLYKVCYCISVTILVKCHIPHTYN